MRWGYSITPHPCPEVSLPPIYECGAARMESGPNRRAYVGWVPSSEVSWTAGMGRIAMIRADLEGLLHEQHVLTQKGALRYCFWKKPKWPRSRLGFFAATCQTQKKILNSFNAFKENNLSEISFIVQQTIWEKPSPSIILHRSCGIWWVADATSSAYLHWCRLCWFRGNLSWSLLRQSLYTSFWTGSANRRGFIRFWAWRALTTWCVACAK